MFSVRALCFALALASCACWRRAAATPAIPDEDAFIQFVWPALNSSLVVDPAHLRCDALPEHALVACDAFGNFLELRLSGLALSGSIPVEMEMLSRVQYVDFSRNVLT